MPVSPTSSNTHNAVTVETPLLPQTHLDIVQDEHQASPSPECCVTKSSNPVETMGTGADSAGAERSITFREASHNLFRFHLYDWLALVSLAILDAVLYYVISPFHRFVGKTMIGDLMYPLLSSTVPNAAVPVIAVLIPVVIFVAFFLYSKDVTDLHHATLGVLFAVLITGVLIDAIKDAVGRPRPDFFWRCFPDGVEVYNNVTGNVVCHGDYDVIKEGYKSFPSAHTGWSFAGLGFLSLYLAGKLQLFNGRGHVGKVAVVFTPLLAAMLVGLSRVDDYWHHWQDVFAGAFIGLVMAAICYHEFFPSVLHENSTGPYSYLQIGNNFTLRFLPWYRHQQDEGSTTRLQNGHENDLESVTR